MRLLARLVAVAGLVVTGGLALPGGAAQAAACSGTSGVTVVIDYGSSSSTLCAADRSSAMAVLQNVAAVVSPAQYPGTVVCKLNGVPSSQTCQRMPPQSAYWAFFHAARGGSWSYSSAGVADYDPAPGTVIGFAFGSGGAPSTAPPAATVPKQSTKPSPSSSSSIRPPAPKPKPKPSATSPTQPRGSVSMPPHGATTTVPRTTAGQATTATTGASTTTGTTSSSSSSSTSSTAATEPTADPADRTGETTAAASPAADGSGSPTTLLAGLGLVGLVGAGAAYLAVRRRAHP
jgi:hypothetical protein